MSSLQCGVRVFPLVAFILAGLAPSDTVLAEGLFTLKSENDIYAGGSDGHYTNGLEATWAFRPSLKHPMSQFAEWLPGWSADRLDGASYRLAHQIYTPLDIGSDDLEVSDRPYAGLLLGGVSLFRQDNRARWRRLDQFGVDVGLVGPGAGGKFTQRELHDVLDSEAPQGWQYQLDNEPVFNIAYESSWLADAQLLGLEVEYGPSVGYALGNLYTYASSGLGLRFGESLAASAGVPAIAPAQGGHAFFLPGRGTGWYAFVSLEGRYMAHNLLLDGNTFRDSHSVEREAWVGDALLGIAWHWDRWQLSATHAWRSKEFESQTRADSFGSLAVSYWY